MTLPVELTACDRCGGDAATGVLLTTGELLCLPCAYPAPNPDHAPQGEALALFTPAPAVMRGQRGLFQ